MHTFFSFKITHDISLFSFRTKKREAKKLRTILGIIEVYAIKEKQKTKNRRFWYFIVFVILHQAFTHSCGGRLIITNTLVYNKDSCLFV